MSAPTSSSRLISFRPVTGDDHALVLAIYRSTRTEELELVSWWTDEQKNAFVQMQLDAQHSHYRVTFPQAKYSIVLVDHRPVGRIYVAELENELRILDLTLLAEERNFGIGSQLLSRLLEQSRQLQKPLSIHVENFNRSLTLLERLGFRKVSETGIYFLMQHAAEQSPAA
jgi:ribosomal protein S18 acetylase RimI-like enzyme